MTHEQPAILQTLTILISNKENLLLCYMIRFSFLRSKPAWKEQRVWQKITPSKNLSSKKSFIFEVEALPAISTRNINTKGRGNSLRSMTMNQIFISSFSQHLGNPPPVLVLASVYRIDHPVSSIGPVTINK